MLIQSQVTYERRVVLIGRVLIGCDCLTSKLFRHKHIFGVVLSWPCLFDIIGLASNNNQCVSYGRGPNFSRLI